MNNNSFEFTLESPLAAVKSLILYSPRNIHRPIIDCLASMFICGMNSMSKGNEKKDVSHETSKNSLSDITASEIAWMIKSVPSDNYDFAQKFSEKFKMLLLSDGICQNKADNSKFGEAYYDQLSIEDGDRLMGEYVKNFIINSISF